MIIYKQSKSIHQFLSKQKLAGIQIGFVPTMGALHAGHLSLIEQSKTENELTVCSIFVNPKQFNNSQDLQRYPVTIEQDIYLLEQSGCDILFLPSYSEIYPSDYQFKSYDLGYLENILEGKYRPGHFQGVCAVVEQLLNICVSDRLYLGKKDYQQCMVIKKLCNIIENKIEVFFCDTKRESDGLAMSSRNARLSQIQRNKACVLFKALQHISNNYQSDKLKAVDHAYKMIISEGFQIDYLQVCDDNLNEMNSEYSSEKKLALVAASIDDIRLIDNVQFT